MYTLFLILHFYLGLHNDKKLLFIFNAVIQIYDKAQKIRDLSITVVETNKNTVLRK